MRPAIATEQHRDSLPVRQPNRQIEIRVGTGDDSEVEVDRPTTKEPRRDSLALERLQNSTQRQQLRISVHTN
jgi:hypothetical protein